MVDLTRAWTEVIVDHDGLAEYGLPAGKLMVTRVRDCHMFESHLLPGSCEPGEAAELAWVGPAP